MLLIERKVKGISSDRRPSITAVTTLPAKNTKMYSTEADEEATITRQFIGIFASKMCIICLCRFFDYVLEVKPNSIVIYNNIFFEWPFVEARARIFGIGIEDEIGFARDSADDYKSRNCIRIDAFRWVKRDSYLPVGSQYLKSVAKANLHCDPVEVIQKMSEMATKEPQSLASYSISGIVATYYLYMKYVHPFVLCCVQSFRLDQMIYRQGTGGGLDLPLEQAIANASASFTEADMLIAQSLGKEAVMSGVGRMESFVDKGADSDSGSTLRGNRRRRRAGGRANFHDFEEDGGRERRETPVRNECTSLQKEGARFGGDSDSSESTLGGNRRRRRAGGRANLDDVEQDEVMLVRCDPYRFYVHYIDCNRRLDEWVGPENHLDSLRMPQKGKEGLIVQAVESTSASASPEREMSKESAAMRKTKAAAMDEDSQDGMAQIGGSSLNAFDLLFWSCIDLPNVCVLTDTYYYNTHVVEGFSEEGDISRNVLSF
ncbi:unnamed protein product [Cylicocyclus nassatus]|uniref:DNA polymerase epsilon catalytic subunit n=1 Tax=Cylicocyclus nassatus TaxID=53992 RepID=A0AA36GX41_CYLNA|nr:unnamed protein product [Cylicocyclus nassatus]